MNDKKNRNPSVAVKSVAMKKPESLFAEQPPQKIEMAPARLLQLTRRDVLLFGAGALAALAGAGFLLPQNTLSRLGIRGKMKSPGKEWFLNQALHIDDDVAEALCSGNRMVPTYNKSQITDLKNNYNGATPDPGYISGWNLTLDGLASGLTISLDIRKLMTRFSVQEEITRLVCIEGGVRLRGGLDCGSMICFVRTHRCRKLNERVWSLRSISMPRGILILTLCHSIWRRPAIRRRCSPHTSTVSPLPWIMEHHSVCWCP